METVAIIAMCEDMISAFEKSQKKENLVDLLVSLHDMANVRLIPEKSTYEDTAKKLGLVLSIFVKDNVKILDGPVLDNINEDEILAFEQLRCCDAFIQSCAALNIEVEPIWLAQYDEACDTYLDGLSRRDEGDALSEHVLNIIADSKDIQPFIEEVWRNI